MNTNKVFTLIAFLVFAVLFAYSCPIAIANLSFSNILITGIFGVVFLYYGYKLLSSNKVKGKKVEKYTPID